MYASKVKPALFADSDFTVAIATVQWFVSAGFKRHLSIFAALGTFYREHLPLYSVTRTTVFITLWFPYLTTGGTALGFVGEALRSEELLLFSSKGKGCPTIRTLE